jgi:hypothetical protein
LFSFCFCNSISNIILCRWYLSRSPHPHINLKSLPTTSTAVSSSHENAVKIETGSCFLNYSINELYKVKRNWVQIFFCFSISRRNNAHIKIASDHRWDYIKAIHAVKIETTAAENNKIQYSDKSIDCNNNKKRKLIQRAHAFSWLSTLLHNETNVPWYFPFKVIESCVGVCESEFWSCKIQRRMFVLLWLKIMNKTTKQLSTHITK